MGPIAAGRTSGHITHRQLILGRATSVSHTMHRAGAVERSLFFPSLCFGGQIIALCRYHAEEVPGWGAHNPPRLDLGFARRAKCLKALHFDLDSTLSVSISR